MGLSTRTLRSIALFSASERVLSHRLGVAATVGCHWYTLRELAQRNKVHASDHELNQPRAGQIGLPRRTAALWRY
jgi:hypothetical protein